MKQNEAQLIIGQNVRRFRIKNAMTQADLADKCQIQKAALSRIEAGKTNVTIKTLTKICNALQLALADLINQL